MLDFAPNWEEKKKKKKNPQTNLYFPRANPREVSTKVRSLLGAGAVSKQIFLIHLALQCPVPDPNQPKVMNKLVPLKCCERHCCVFFSVAPLTWNTNAAWLFQGFAHSNFITASGDLLPPSG